MIVYSKEKKRWVSNRKNSDSFENFVCSSFSAGELFELIQTKKTCKEVLDELIELFIEELEYEAENEELDELTELFIEELEYEAENEEDED